MDVTAARRRAGGVLATTATALVAVIVAGFSLSACTSDLLPPASTERFTIPSRSMEPTLMEGDVVTVDTAAPDDGNLRRGDLVVFEKPGCGVSEDSPEPECFEVKRVIGLSGETIRVMKEGVSVNGELLNEPYIASGGTGPTGVWVAEPGTALVLGDNRSQSADSRTYGPISAGSMHGLVVDSATPAEAS